MMKRHLLSGRRTVSVLRILAIALATGIAGCAMQSGADRSEAAFRNEVVRDHAIYSRETRHLVEVSADDVEHLQMWLGQRLQHDFAVPDLSAAGLRFAGGRMLAIDGQPAAQLMYTRDQGLPVAICITPMEGGPSPVSFEQRGALRAASWRDTGFAYVVVGELDDAAIHDIARRAAAQMGS